jgi:hypothetical protein
VKFLSQHRKARWLNHIKGKKIPSNLRNGSSIYIDHTITLQTEELDRTKNMKEASKP